MKFPRVYLAHCDGAQGDNSLKGMRGVKQVPPESTPSLLWSYVYVRPFLEKFSEYACRDWILDSGAYTAHTQGIHISIEEYTAFCKELLSRQDLRLSEVYALDVISDWRASVKNAEYMWSRGVPAIPCFHQGEPWDVLLGMARDYPKIALGNMVGLRAPQKLAWLKQCFARVWPKKIHGFGLCADQYMTQLPFHTVDATNWEVGPCKFGTWKAFGGNLSVRGSKQDLRAEIEYYLRMERKAQSQWRRDMEKLDV